MTTAEQHYGQSVAALDRSTEWWWKDVEGRTFTDDQRLALRMADLAEAQVQATLAQVQMLTRQYAVLSSIADLIGNLP